MAETKRPRDKNATLPLRSRSTAPCRPPEPSEPVSARSEHEARSHGRTDALPGAASSALVSEIPRPAPVPAGMGKDIELLIVNERRSLSGERKGWRAAEVWTKRRIYGLDSTFKCVQILDRATGRPETGHDMLGARLGGGRLREQDEVRFSYPLPLPGMEAIFVKGNKHGYTSTVERMVVRVRVLRTSADEPPPTWDEIASRWSERP